MTLTDIQKAVLDDDIDNVIAQYLKTDDCRVVYAWIEENIIQLRFWALNKMANTNTLSPQKTSTIIENAESDYDKFLFECYKKVDDLYPLTKTQTAKERARSRIYKELGDYDVYEMVADLSKRICLLERLLIRFADAAKTDGSLPEPIAQLYGDMIDAYMIGLTDQTIKDRTDLENNWLVFRTLQTRTAKIAEIIEEEMY